ncbi:larval/pupal cuticle protein H1C [Drosophila tropicalis]|uniref:larval/pupal cuticle protein H1C n=1 Tax=Drosophila tropicalis TaxID=46794 RepID=UPI0035AC07F2
MANQILGISASILVLLLVPTAWAGIIAQPASGISYLNDEHAVAHTHQDVIRNFDGTVSHYTKSVATPYSQVHKQDTRISNNVYQPAIAKTLTYAAPAPAPVAVHHQPTLFTQAPAPVSHSPAAVYQQQYGHIPSPIVSHQPAIVHYSPAEAVSHMTFDGFGTHWGY